MVYGMFVFYFLFQLCPFAAVIEGYCLFVILRDSTSREIRFSFVLLIPNPSDSRF